MVQSLGSLMVLVGILALGAVLMFVDDFRWLTRWEEPLVGLCIGSVLVGMVVSILGRKSGHPV